MSTPFTFAVIIAQVENTNFPGPSSTPFSEDPNSVIGTSDKLMIIGKPGEGALGASGASFRNDTFGTKCLGELTGWVTGDSPETPFVNAPPPANAGGSVQSAMYTPFGGPKPLRGDKVTSVVKLVGQIGHESVNTEIWYFQAYTGVFA